MNVQVTDACAPRVTASPFYTCRPHKRDFGHLAIGGLQPTPVRMVEAVDLVACHVVHMADRDDQHRVHGDGADPAGSAA